MMVEPHWTAYLSALLAPTVAILGSLIAYRQWRIAQSKLKLDLFDRRFRVFEAARNLIAFVVARGKTDDEQIGIFVGATREARWLFDAGIADYLNVELHNSAVELETLFLLVQDPIMENERVANILKKAELKKWFYAQYAVLEDKFAPYLQLRH
jgi:hypothetical protein